MADLASFIRARLDEWQAMAEAAAREADDGSHFGGRASWAHRFGMVTDAEDPDWAITDLTATGAGDSIHGHIALNDPARVLRQVAAMRAILDEHGPSYPVTYPSPSGQPTCGVCHAGGWDWDPEDWPCATIRSLAAIWSDHPDYPSAMADTPASHPA